MTDKQPAQFDWATELSDAQGHVTLSKQEAKEIGARLRNMGAKLKTYEDLGDAADDVQLLRMGYAAARLEIESLKSQLSAEPLAPRGAPHLPERDASVPAERQGLFRKFDVRRVDGSDQPGGKHHGCRYFVLDVDHDPRAHAALTAYAAACESSHPKLAADLRSKWGAAPTTQPAPQQEAQEPVWWYVTGCGRLLDEHEAKTEAKHIGGTARAVPLYTTPQPSPAAQGNALSDDAVRVPLDKLHADAAYLIGRLREGSMPHARVIEIIRERIDAAKAAIRARAAQGDALDAARYRWLREGNDAKHGAAWHVAVNLYGCEWDAAIDAALAAQEGKK